MTGASELSAVGQIFRCWKAWPRCEFVLILIFDDDHHDDEEDGDDGDGDDEDDGDGDGDGDGDDDDEVEKGRRMRIDIYVGTVLFDFTSHSIIQGGISIIQGGYLATKLPQILVAAGILHRQLPQNITGKLL